MATVETLNIDVKASVDKAVSSFTRVKGSLSSVSGESKTTTKSVKDTALAFEATAEGVAKASKEMAKAGFKNVSGEVARISKHLKATNIGDLTAAVRKQADEFEAKGDKATADLLRERANPVARESEIIDALKQQRDAEKAVADEIKRKKELEKEAEKAFADGEKVIKDIVKKQEQEKRDAATQTWRETQELLMRQAADERKAVAESALAEKMRHNAAMEDLKQKLLDQRDAQAEASRAAKQKAKDDKDAEDAAKRRAKEEKKLSEELQKQEEASKEQGLKSVNKAFEGLSNILPNLRKRLFGVFRMFGRIAMYRAVRAAIKTLTAALKEGLTNLKAYSQEVGTAFAPAVDNLRSHVLWLKNAIATALRPVIEALIPIIQRLVDWLVKASDFLAQVFSIMTGKLDDKGRYTKAVLTDIQESNEEAKKLQRTLLGFDEINRLDGENGKDNSQNAGLMFTQADPSEKAVEWAGKLTEWLEKIKEFVGGIDWELVLKVLAALELTNILSKVVGWLKPIGRVLKLLGGGLKKIIGFLGGAGGIAVLVAAIIVAFGLWGDKISEWFGKAKTAVEGFFDGLKGFSGLANAVADLLKHIIGGVLDTVGTIASLVYKLVHGDINGVGEDLLKLLETLVRLLVRVIFDAINIVLGLVEDLLNAILRGVRWLWNNAIQPFLNWVLVHGENLRIWMRNTWIDIQIGVLNVIKWLKERIDEALSWIVDKINVLIETSNEILGTEFKPIEFKPNTEALDAKIAELEGKKLEPLKEDVEIVGKWTAPANIKLQFDTSDADRLVDNLFKKVNKLGTAVASTVSALGAAEGNRSRINIQKYASGGFPTMGTVFVAGESGAEYIADINGRTGVYNTDQMSNAMYKAMVAALATMPQQGGDIYLDGEVIYRNTVRRNNNQVRATGRTALLT